MYHSVPSPPQYLSHNASASFYLLNDGGYRNRGSHLCGSSSLSPPLQLAAANDTRSSPFAANNAPVVDYLAVAPRSQSGQSDIRDEVLSQSITPAHRSRASHAPLPVACPQPVYPTSSYSIQRQSHLSHIPADSPLFLCERASAPNPDHGWNTALPPSPATNADKSAESSPNFPSPSMRLPFQQQDQSHLVMDRSAPLSSHDSPATHISNAHQPNLHSVESTSGALSASDAVSRAERPEVPPSIGSLSCIKEETPMPGADDEDRISRSPSGLHLRKGPKMHKCQHCLKQFPRPSGLATHMNMHNNVRPYPCPFPGCDKSFSVRSNATRHLRTHGTDAAPYLLPRKSNDSGNYERIRFEKPVVFTSEKTDQIMEIYWEQPQ